MCPLLLAQCRGVTLPLVSQTFTLAPAFSNKRTLSSFPEHVARCNADLMNKGIVF